MKRGTSRSARYIWVAALVPAVLFINFTKASSQEPLALSGFGALTRNYNNQRTGANLSETILNTSNVNSSQFGKLFQLEVDDQVYAGLLYASAVSIAGGTHNVVYVATVNNTVYAFDADAAGAPLWQRNFNGSGRPSRSSDVGQACGTYRDFSGNIGIVGGPVIDGSTMIMYFVTRTVEGSATVQRLRAIDITTGSDRVGAKVIQATVPGTGDGTSGGNVAFNPQTQNQRPSLALSQGVVYIGWASFCDTKPYHGWVMAYDAATLAQLGVFNTSPNGTQGGVWMSGNAAAFDSNGNVYVGTGNGSFDGNTAFGESMLRLAPRNLSLADWFTPTNESDLNNKDLDFGSGGPIFLPNSSLFVTGGKQGKIYLLDSNRLGHMVTGDTQIPESFQAVDPTARPTATHNIHNGAAVWESPQGLDLYIWGENDFLRSYRFGFSTQTFSTSAFSVASILPPIGMPGGMIAVSANGSQAGTGVVWATIPRAGDANQAVVPGNLHAFNAENLSLLWSSTGAGDDIYNFSKGSPPLVAKGKVYVASLSNVVSVYGPRATPPPSQNLALSKPATASTPCASTETPDKAFNGSFSGGNGDKWCSLASTKFLQVDLGANKTINQFVIEHAGAGGESFTLNTRDFNIQLSTDGTNFSPAVVNVTGNIQSVTTHNISPATARFVRLNITAPTQTTDAAARIYEFQVYGPSGPSVPPPVTFEAESLPVAAFTSGRVERVASDTGYSGGQGVILEGHAVADFITFTVNVPEARTYDLRVRIKQLTNRGIWQFDINGANLGPRVDGFAPSSAFPEVDIGPVTFTSAGNRSFRFTVTGKNASSTDFWVAIDYIKLIPQ